MAPRRFPIVRNESVLNTENNQRAESSEILCYISRCWKTQAGSEVPLSTSKSSQILPVAEFTLMLPKSQEGPLEAQRTGSAGTFLSNKPCLEGEGRAVFTCGRWDGAAGWGLPGSRLCQCLRLRVRVQACTSALLLGRPASPPLPRLETLQFSRTAM